MILSSPVVNWPQFVESVQGLIGKSPTRCLDQFSLDLNNPYSLLVALQSLRESDFNPWTGKIDNDFLQHITLTFFEITRYTVAEEIYSSSLYLKTSHIALNRENCLLLMIGSLLDWQFLLPDILSYNKSTEIRLIFTKIYSLFKSSDLRNLWSNYEINKLKDNTLIMRLK